MPALCYFAARLLCFVFFFLPSNGRMQQRKSNSSYIHHLLHPSMRALKSWYMSSLKFNTNKKRIEKVANFSLMSQGCLKADVWHKCLCVNSVRALYIGMQYVFLTCKCAKVKTCLQKGHIAIFSHIPFTFIKSIHEQRYSKRV